MAGLEVVRLLNESSAVLMAYFDDYDKDEAEIVLINLDSFSMDVIIYAIDNGVYEILS